MSIINISSADSKQVRDRTYPFGDANFEVHLKTPIQKCVGMQILNASIPLTYNTISEDDQHVYFYEIHGRPEAIAGVDTVDKKQFVGTFKRHGSYNADQLAEQLELAMNSAAEITTATIASGALPDENVDVHRNTVQRDFHVNNLNSKILIALKKKPRPNDGNYLDAIGWDDLQVGMTVYMDKWKDAPPEEENGVVQPWRTIYGKNVIDIDPGTKLVDTTQPSLGSILAQTIQVGLDATTDTIVTLFGGTPTGTVGDDIVALAEDISEYSYEALDLVAAYAYSLIADPETTVTPGQSIAAHGVSTDQEYDAQGRHRMYTLKVKFNGVETNVVVARVPTNVHDYPIGDQYYYKRLAQVKDLDDLADVYKLYLYWDNYLCLYDPVISSIIIARTRYYKNEVIFAQAGINIWSADDNVYFGFNNISGDPTSPNLLTEFFADNVGTRFNMDDINDLDQHNSERMAKVIGSDSNSLHTSTNIIREFSNGQASSVIYDHIVQNGVNADGETFVDLLSKNQFSHPFHLAHNHLSRFQQVLILGNFPETQGPTVLYLRISGDPLFDQQNTETGLNDRFPIALDENHGSVVHFEGDTEADKIPFSVPCDIQNFKIKLEYGDTNNIVGGSYSQLRGHHIYLRLKFYKQPKKK